MRGAPETSSHLNSGWWGTRNSDVLFRADSDSPVVARNFDVNGGDDRRGTGSVVTAVSRFGWGPVLEVVTAIASIDDPALYGPSVLEALAPVLDFDPGSYNEVNPVAHRVIFSAYPPEERWHVSEEVRAAFPRLVLQNPILQHQSDREDTVAQGRDALSRPK